MGALFNRLLFETCKAETEKALRFEGAGTIQYAFQVFGQAASRELLGNPSVAAGLAGVAKYIDAAKLGSLIASPATPESDQEKNSK